MYGITHLSTNMVKALLGIGFQLEHIKGMTKKKAMAHIMTDLNCRKTSISSVRIDDKTGRMIIRHKA